MFFGKKNFVRKKNSQNVFQINWGSGEHEEKFLEIERGRETSKNLDKKVNSLTETKLVVVIVGVGVVELLFFFLFLFFWQ
jgi:hypothetical protein